MTELPKGIRRRSFLTAAGGAAGAVYGRILWGQQRNYLTSDQALKLVFPKADQILPETHTLTPEQESRVETGLQLRLSTPTQSVYRGLVGGATDGYAMILDEIGKSEFITLVVGLNADFRIRRVALMTFREIRGWEVSDARFTNQFKGKSDKDPIAIGRDIVGITGATLSSRAFCRGARKAILVCEALYGS